MYATIIAKIVFGVRKENDMGVYIPNMSKPKSCAECELWSNCFYPKAPKEIDNKVTPDCPLIEIDESEMEYLYKEFGLEKDENLTVRAIELKYAILMGYAYAKREIVPCGECKHYAFGLCSKLHLVTDPKNFCSDGERRTDEKDNM